MTDQGLTAARQPWKSVLHPRGRDGRFIEVGGAVKWLFGGQEHVGDVTEITAGRDGKPVVSVRERNGQVSVLKPEQLAEAIKAKAHLAPGAAPAVRQPGETFNTPGPPPGAGEAKAHLEGPVHPTRHLAKGYLRATPRRPGPQNDPLAEVRGRDIGTKKKWIAGKTQQEQDALADPVNTIPTRVREIVGPRTQYPGTAQEAVAQRITEASTDPLTGKNKITPDAQKAIGVMLHQLDVEIQAMASEDGAPKPTEAERKLFLVNAAEYLVAQEYEAEGRSLGDHGVRHLASDADYAIKAINTMTDGKATPRQRAMMITTAIFHDTGYLTPPSREFMDDQHPHWSMQNWKENMGPSASLIFGRTDTTRIGSYIVSHAGTKMDWENDLEGSAFRVADNLGLFHHDKLPSFAYAVPANTSVLIRLGQRVAQIQQANFDDEAKQRHLTFAVEQAKISMHNNLHESGLDAPTVERMDQAIDEISTISPKFLVGMVGAKVQGFTKDKDALHVTLTQNRASEDLQRVLDVGQRQFKKFSETYVGEDNAEAILKGPVDYKANGKTVMVVELNTPPSAPTAEAIRRLYSDTEHHGFTGRPTKRGLTKPTTGFSVAIPGHTLVIPPDKAKDKRRTTEIVTAWMDQQAEILQGNNHVNLGAWTEDETGEVYLDLAEVYDSPQQAEAAGKARDEKAIWDIAKGEPIPIGGTGGRDTVAVAAGGHDGSDTQADVRVPAGLASVDPGREASLRGAAARHHPARGDDDGGTPSTHGGDMTTPDDLRSRVHGPEALTAAWTPSLHPRGKDGKFIEVGAYVQYLVNGKKRTGYVRRIEGPGVGTRANGDLKPHMTLIYVDQEHSNLGDYVRPKDILRSIKSKADLDATTEPYMVNGQWVVPKKKAVVAASATPDELRARVYGVTAAGKWSEALHPRGHDGRFIEIGALVRFLSGGKPQTGKVTGITADKKGTGSKINVVDGKGKTYSISNDDVLRSVPVKADIDNRPEVGTRILVGDDIAYVDTNGRDVHGLVDAIEDGPNGTMFRVNNTDVPEENVVGHMSRAQYNEVFKGDLEAGTQNDLSVKDFAKEAIDRFAQAGADQIGLTAPPRKEADLTVTPGEKNAITFEGLDPNATVEDFRKGQRVRRVNWNGATVDGVVTGDDGNGWVMFQEDDPSGPFAGTPYPADPTALVPLDQPGTKANISTEGNYADVSALNQPGHMQYRTDLPGEVLTWIDDLAAEYDGKLPTGADWTLIRKRWGPIYGLKEIDRAYKLKKDELRSTTASATPWKDYLAMLASGAVKPDSPFLTSDGMSWNGEAIPDKVRVAITAPMGKISDTTVAEALNALYRTLVLSPGTQVPLDTITQQVDQLETVAAADGTDSGDAATLQKVSKLVRTIFAIPDQADLDRAQEKANSKAKSLGGPSKSKEAAPADGGNDAPAAEAAAPAPDAAPAEGDAAPVAPDAAPVAAAAPDAASLRARVHG